MIRRPPRSTHTLSLHDALPISKSTRCQRLLPIVQREMLVLTLSILSGVNCSLRVAFLGLLLYALITRNFLSRGNAAQERSEEHTSELQSLMRISYAVFCLKQKRRHKRIANKTEKKNEQK